MTRLLFAIVFATWPAFATKTIGNPHAPQGGSFFYNLGYEPSTLNPLSETEQSAKIILDYIFSPLMSQNQDTLQFESSVANSVESAKDELSFVVNLNKNARWSNGKPVTAEDVKYSFDVIRDPTMGAQHLWTFYENIKSVEILADDKIKISAKEKYFKNLETICSTLILPKGSGGKILLGSGPYRLTQYDRGKKLTLEKVENWWGADVENFKGRYNFKNVIFKFIPDATIQIEAIQKGDIDFINTRMSFETYFKRAVGPAWGKSVLKIKVENQESRFDTIIGWNLKRNFFSNREVRKALVMLFNRREINEKFRFGLSKLATGPFSNGIGNDPSLEPIEYNPKKAMQILKSAGWCDADKSGTLSKMVDGQKLEFKFSLSYQSKNNEKYWTLYKEELRKVGIQMSLSLMDITALRKQMDERTFDAFAVSWGGDYESDPKQTWSSSSDVAGGTNFVGYKNFDVDREIELARVETNDQKRSQLLKKIDRMIAEDAPFAFLFTETTAMYAVTSRIGRTRDTFKYDVGPTYWYVKQETK